MTTALSFTGIFQDQKAVIVLAVIGILLMSHGFYELFFKPKVFLKSLLKKWLFNRNWKIIPEITRIKYPEYVFNIAVENAQNYRLAITKSKINSGVLLFHTTIPEDVDRDSRLSLFTSQQQDHLLEDIRLFLAGKDMPFGGIKWPLNEVYIEAVLPIDSHVSEQLVDDKCKQVVFAIVGINTLIRKALASSTPDKGDSLSK